MKLGAILQSPVVGELLPFHVRQVDNTDMTTAEYQTDLPSPTHRDSAASAIFNLYGYSSRNSSHSQGTFGAFQQSNGLVGNGDMRNQLGYPAEDDGDGLVEELRSPQIEGFMDQPNSKLKTAQDDSSSRIPNGNLDPTQNEPVHALGPPVRGTASTNGRQPLESPDKYRTSSINRPTSITDQQGLSSSVQESDARNRRRSSNPSVVPATGISSRPVDPPRTELLDQQVEVSAPPAAHLDVPRERDSQMDSIARRQPGEEEDAYHVRSTCESPSAISPSLHELK